jgi:hypothetical protein
MITFHLFSAGVDGVKVVLNNHQQSAAMLEADRI